MKSMRQSNIDIDKVLINQSQLLAMSHHVFMFSKSHYHKIKARNWFPILHF